MSLLPPPRLVRSNATVPALTTTHPTSSTNQDYSSKESRRLIAQVLAAYNNLPFKGAPLVLPGDVVVVDDVWRAALEDELDDLALRGFNAVRAFSLEAWLGAKVARDGTDDQRAALQALVASLPPEGATTRYDAFPTTTTTTTPELIDDGFYSNGLPADIMSVVHQPLVEVPVYRDLSDLAVPASTDTPRASEVDDDASGSGGVSAAEPQDAAGSDELRSAEQDDADDVVESS